MPDSSVIDAQHGHQQHQQQEGANGILSAETLLAIRRYNQDVASYTLRQWNVAKLESERKERDRRKRRADRAAAAAATSGSTTTTLGSAPASSSVSGASSLSSSATPGARVTNGLASARAGSRPPTDRPYHQHQYHYPPPDSDGPLMMVSRRKAERGFLSSGTTSTAAPFSQRHSHDGRLQHKSYQQQQHQQYSSQQASHQIYDVAERPAHHHAATAPRLHTRSYQTPSSSVPLPVPTTSRTMTTTAQIMDHGFDRPATQHIESVARGVPRDAVASSSSSSEDEADEDDQYGRLETPPRSWQRRPSGSTPPIPIPAPRQHHHGHAHGHHHQRQGSGSAGTSVGVTGSSAASSAHSSHSAPSGSSRSSSAPRHSPTARALGYSAHLGMTSISHGSGGVPPSTSVPTDSASSSNPTSEGSSRISSFSESSIRQSMKKEDELTGTKDRSGRPKPTHHGSSSSSYKGAVPGANAVEGAIGTLRRMTISEEEEDSVLGPLDHH